jgi:hypothetical protein
VELRPDPLPGVAVKARGILFRGESVLAILNGPKRVTRRVGPTWARVRPGDLLWGREVHCWADSWWRTEGYDLDPPASIGYRADHRAYAIREGRPAVELHTQNWGWETARWRAAMFMPRWGSRLNLVVTSVREIPPPPIGLETPAEIAAALEVDDAEALREGAASAADFGAVWLGMHGAIWPIARRISFELGAA